MASKEDALRECGGKSFTAATRKKAEDCMRGELECYDSYLRGEAYGFELYKDCLLYTSIARKIVPISFAVPGTERKRTRLNAPATATPAPILPLTIIITTQTTAGSMARVITKLLV